MQLNAKLEGGEGCSEQTETESQVGLVDRLEVVHGLKILVPT